jgi:hypothetical protein
MKYKFWVIRRKPDGKFLKKYNFRTFTWEGAKDKDKSFYESLFTSILGKARIFESKRRAEAKLDLDLLRSIGIDIDCYQFTADEGYPWK